jgi:hypothetical protein
MAIDATQRLAEYWFRARLMHDLLHALMEAYDDDLRAIDKDGHSWEFLTYLDYWLSALFVVVEGFNKLKLKDARVQRLFSPHVSQLKELRHGSDRACLSGWALSVMGREGSLLLPQRNNPSTLSLTVAPGEAPSPPHPNHPVSNPGCSSGWGSSFSGRALARCPVSPRSPCRLLRPERVVRSPQQRRFRLLE